MLRFREASGRQSIAGSTAKVRRRRAATPAPSADRRGVTPWAYIGGMTPRAYIGGVTPRAYIGGVTPRAYIGGVTPPVPTATSLASNALPSFTTTANTLSPPASAERSAGCSSTIGAVGGTMMVCWPPL